MRLSKIIATILLTLNLGACVETIKIENGIVPNELLPHVEKILGVYVSKDNNLILSLKNGALEIATKKDLIDLSNSFGCNSKIGNLLELSYSGDLAKNNIEITRAQFQFDPNLCQNIQGKTLTIENINMPNLKTSILDHYEARRECRIEVITDPSGATSPREVCNTDWVPQNIQDNFTRILR